MRTTPAHAHVDDVCGPDGTDGGIAEQRLDGAPEIDNRDPELDSVPGLDLRNGKTEPASVKRFIGLARSDNEIAGVVTRPDKPRGRGRPMASPEVKVAAEGLSLPVLQPDSLRDEAFHDDLRSLDADLFVVVAFLILPRSLLKIPHPLTSTAVHSTTRRPGTNGCETGLRDSNG